MDPNLYTQWVQQPQLLPDPSHQHEARSSTLDDWAKERSTTTNLAGGAGSPLAPGTGMDISDFTTLGDLGGSTTSPSSLASPSQSFFSPYQHTSYFVPAPYTTMAYGSTWPPQTHLPLSNYSSLNGATTSSTPSTSSSLSQTQQQSSTQQQQSSKSQPQPQTQPLQLHTSTQPLMIDPALTTMNGSRSASTNMQHYPQANYTAQASQSQQQLSQYQYSHLLHPSLSYRPASYYQQQQHQSPQGTLSPQALHSPSSSMLNTLMPSSFYSPTPTSTSSTSTTPSASISQKPSPQERKQQFQTSIRPLLQAAAFTGAQAVNQLVDRITEYGIQEVDAATRLEILTKMRDGAGNHYFRAWSENPEAIDITRDWLKAGFTASNDSPLVETIMPLLHIIDRLPMTVDSLKASKLGKIVVKLVKDPPSPAIKDMASNVERRWRDMVSGAEAPLKSSDKNGTEDAKTKKRKLGEPALGKGIPPSKKSAVGTASSSKPVVVKKETKASVAAAVKDAKSDSSFFSAPKPKPKLPSFKKAPTPAASSSSAPAKPSAANVAQPSSIDPFQEALKSMGKGRRESPAVSTPPAATSTPPQAPAVTKNGKKRKSVSWAPQAQLESVRLIEKAVYDDDPVDGKHVSHNLRDLDRGEGAALHAHLFEETVDWSEPTPLEIPIDIEVRPRGEGSQEKVTQEQREQTALSALYSDNMPPPPSPAEPAQVIPEEEVDKNVQTMTAGPEVDAVFWSSGPVSPVSQSVADLVGQLAVGRANVDPALGGSQFNGQGLDLTAVGLDGSATLSAVQALPQEQLQQLLQQLAGTFPPPAAQQQQPQQQQQQQQQPYPGADQPPAWPSGPVPNYSAEYGQGFHNDGAERGWGRGNGRGRGRGRGRGDDGYRQSKRKPCSFFQAGRCKYGDLCDFAHD